MKKKDGKEKTKKTKQKEIAFHVITLFPELVESYLSHSILKRGIEDKRFRAHATNPRDFTTDKHHKADDRPYGGGPGMVLKAEPILKAVEEVLRKSKVQSPKSKVMTDDSRLMTKILIMSPRGRQFTNDYAKKLVKDYDHIVLIAGHYEGIDARVVKALRDRVKVMSHKSSDIRKSSGLRTRDSGLSVEEVSIGPYTVTGGELPALIIIDAAARQIEGVLGASTSLEESRITSGETYTRPETLVWKKREYPVPKVLRSGHHAAIDRFRQDGTQDGTKGRPRALNPDGK
jgi:tRNA (guanine37-N1)-methyltransferase